MVWLLKELNLSLRDFALGFESNVHFFLKNIGTWEINFANLDSTGYDSMIVIVCNILESEIIVFPLRGYTFLIVGHLNENQGHKALWLSKEWLLCIADFCPRSLLMHRCKTNYSDLPNKNPKRLTTYFFWYDSLNLQASASTMKWATVIPNWAPNSKFDQLPHNSSFLPNQIAPQIIITTIIAPAKDLIGPLEFFDVYIIIVIISQYWSPCATA